MVMDAARGVIEYDEAGATVQLPMHQCSALALSSLLPERGVLLDLGCGSARLLARLAAGRPDAHLVGLDLSEPMLETGRKLIAREGLADRVELRTGDITNCDSELPLQLNVVSCNLALHHLPNDEMATSCLEAIRRARDETGCGVYIFDVTRLRNRRSWPGMMSLTEVPGPAFLRDAIASERAAFTFVELIDLIRGSGLEDLQHARAGPLGEWQLHWVAGRDGDPAGRWHNVPLPRDAHLVTQLVLRSFPRELAHRR
jgi:SAM-dependent methyltransferase